MITDSHCHLDFPQFADELDDVINRAHQAGVSRMVSICTSSKGLANVQKISQNNPSVFHAFGIHPLHVHEEPLITLDALLDTTKHPKMIAIGETGIDYHYSIETKDLQIESLHLHITAAQETGLPLIIHSRDADDDMAKILSSRYKEQSYGCVMHCFSSGAELARTALDCGFYLSMSGVTTFKNSNSLREIFRAAPVDRILVETDAPYLAPAPYRGKRNEPAFAIETAKMGASLFDMTFEKFAAQTERNFETLFSKVKS